MIDSDQLTALMPNLANTEDWVAALNKVFSQYEITDGNRLTIFMAQTMYESEYYTELVEDLDYSAEELLKVFPEYFPNDNLADQYAHQPQMIGARVYANRMGNGDEASGDGFTYRGRGLIQITGKDSYASFANSMGMTLSDVVDYSQTLEGAAMVSGWFWNNNDLNQLSDADEFTEITKKINGGLNGLEQRKEIWTNVQNILNS